MMRLCCLSLLLLLATAAAAERPPLVIKGVGSDIEENIRLYLVSEAEDDSWGGAAQLHQRASRAMQPFGYYQPGITINEEDGQLLLTVTPGPRVVWVEPRIEVTGAGAHLRRIKRLLRRHPFQAGAPLSHAAYDRYREEWFNLAQDLGLFEAHWIEHRLVIDPTALTAQAILRMETGPRYRFGNVYFQGGSIDDDVLTPLAPKAGSPYRRQSLQALHRDLQNTNYFGSIQVRSERREDQRVDIHVNLTDAPLDRFSIGAGFGTDTGPRGRFRWTRPQVNSAGHRLQSEIYISKPRTQASAQYLVPLSHPTNHFSAASISLENKDNEDTESRVLDLGYDIHRRLSQDWLFVYGLHLQNERYRQGSEPRQELTYLLPGTSLTQLRIAPGIDPGRGHKTWIELKGSDKSLGADAAFLRVQAGHARLWSLAQKHLLIGRAEVGAIATADIRDIPASQRFFAGGDQSVRGFDYESLSPRDANGQLTGGRFLNVASLEYSYRFAERWRAALFTDAGRAYNEDSEPWHQSVGIGARWLSPVGQIRVDVAFPIDDDRESGWRLHIFMGPPL